MRHDYSKPRTSGLVNTAMGDERAIAIGKVPLALWHQLDHEARRRNVSKAVMLRPYLQKIADELSVESFKS